MALSIAISLPVAVTAMPRLVSPLEPNNSFVQHVKTKIEQAVQRRSSSVEVENLSSGPVNRIKFGRNSGAYFTLMEDQTVGFLYYYRALRTKTRTRFTPSEALAFRFVSGLGYHGKLPSIFWEKLLPEFKLVLSDAQYTEDDRQWWFAQYSFAEANPDKYGIVLCDPTVGVWSILTTKTFRVEYPLYWGSSANFERYRFGIFLRSHEEEIRRNMLSGWDHKDANRNIIPL